MTGSAAAHPVALPFRIGTRTLASPSRRLVRVGWSLQQARCDEEIALPPVGLGVGYLLTSVPPHRIPDAQGMLPVIRQRYRRYFIDLRAGRAAWRAGLSSATRSAIRRKAKRLSTARGGVEILSYRTPDEIAAFHESARHVSVLTYQEKMLGAGLPKDPAALSALAATDDVRAWLLCIDGRAIAYLCCTADGDTLRYDHVGHDPGFSTLSPGAVLQAAALDMLFEDRFAWFDFTEGEGQHKRTFATGSIDCVDMLLLRPTVANRLLATAIRGFDDGIGLSKRLLDRPALAALARKIRRFC